MIRKSLRNEGRYSLQHQSCKKDIKDSCGYNILLGGTTILGFSVIEKHIDLFKDTDIIIILACEGNL